MSFKNFIKEAKIIQAIEDLGFTDPTPIQEKAIPEIQKGHDLRAAAQTGTGKTAAFILPALTRLVESPSKGTGPRILILLPTRELAMQVEAETAKLCRHLPHIVTACVYGGVPYYVQNKKLSKKYDILIATPGRLIDFLKQKKIQLSRVEMMVLDEADRMLDMGFIEPVEYIASLTPQSRQTVMFSATYGRKVIMLAEKLLRDPVAIKIAPEVREQSQIEQHLHHTDNLDHKYRLLEHLLADTMINQAIIFSSTKAQTEQISNKLRQSGLDAAALHGDMNQRQRTRTMQLMRDKKVRFLVATDVAARGIDVQTISHVINFDLPHSLDDYIHRIGRTGRAGSKGIAISFTSYKDHQLRKQIERFAGLQTTPAAVAGQPADRENRKFRPRSGPRTGFQRGPRKRTSFIR